MNTKDDWRKYPLTEHDQEKAFGTKVEEAYLEHLSMMVKRPNRKETYKLLMRRLWYQEFYSIVEHDENREWYACNLRTKYGVNASLFGKARLLEIFIVLARDYVSITKGFKGYRGFKNSFWMMLDNIGVGHLSDQYIIKNVRFEDFELVFQTKFDTFLDRTYNPDGSGGGAFILQKPPKDMRKVELWYQSNYFAIEQNGGFSEK